MESAPFCAEYQGESKDLPPMVHLEVVEVVMMNHPVVEGVSLKGTTQIYPTIDVPCIEVTQCPQRIKPGYTHLAYK